VPKKHSAFVDSREAGAHHQTTRRALGLQQVPRPHRV
jgi:hypothetical protein